jgi:decaprenylphospho-beta-D-ribofuranose 2-oxidase
MNAPLDIRARQRRDAHWVEGWGRLGVPAVERFDDDLAHAGQRAHLFRGLGRSYGDSALPAAGDGEIVATPLADRILSFTDDGVLHAEAGLSLFEMNRLLLPRGWFTPVTPGTQFVTLGGMVASDVHGKNHHVAGCFGQHVRSLTMMVADGAIVRCSPTVHPDLFWATVGGMGLTGHILDVEVQLERVPSPWILQTSYRIPNIDAFTAALKESGQKWPMTVGWIDCVTGGPNLGRGLLMCGRWAEPSEAPAHYPKPKLRLTMPDVIPNWLLNPLSIRAFNTAYYWKHVAREKTGIVHPDSFFYPLDMIQRWNRMYGRRGFTQYQCVLPESAGLSAPRQFLERLTRRGGASFLCVIKDCGAQGQGLLSFPMPGMSIALDIAVTRDTPALLDELNAFVISVGGRIYLTKDTFSRPDQFRAMEPRLDAFLEVKRRWDPDNRFRSAQSMRMFGDLLAPASP